VVPISGRVADGGIIVALIAIRAHPFTELTDPSEAGPTGPGTHTAAGATFADHKRLCGDNRRVGLLDPKLGWASQAGLKGGALNRHTAILLGSKRNRYVP
jgi:hypothetical protein